MNDKYVFQKIISVPRPLNDKMNRRHIFALFSFFLFILLVLLLLLPVLLLLLLLLLPVLLLLVQFRFLISAEQRGGSPAVIPSSASSSCGTAIHAHLCKLQAMLIDNVTVTTNNLKKMICLLV